MITHIAKPLGKTNVKNDLKNYLKMLFVHLLVKAQRMKKSCVERSLFLKSECRPYQKETKPKRPEMF